MAPVRNLGDIVSLSLDDVPDCDLITYSFPCQDISTAGYQRGLDKDSGTRSSLLYKQAGNSIAVPVLEEIFKNLFKKELLEK